MRAVVSVWDKTGLGEFGAGLASLGWEVCSTGKTQAFLAAAGVPVRAVSDLTGFPEILDGRVKTLHPHLHGGILARRDDPAHMAQLAAHHIGAVDLVVSNLYPFLETIAGQPLPAAGSLAGTSLPVPIQEAVEQIDIGGPAMTRAASKNFSDVIVVVDPSDYPAVLDALRHGGVSLEMRARLAQKAFAHTAQYDTYVTQYLASVNGEQFSDRLSLPLTRVQSMSYGENPHQQAAFYRLADARVAGPGLAGMVQLHGDAPSYNNLLDLDSAYAIVAEFDEPAVAIVKHNNPCGVGVGATITEAYRKAYSGDPLSAFGGVIAANRSVGGPMVTEMGGVLYWVLVAPDVTERALQGFQRRQTRVFKMPVPPRDRGTGTLPGFGLQYRPVAGGFLAQTYDALPFDQITFTTVSQRAPTEQELADLRFAWRIVKHVRSNAVVFAKDGAVTGTGAGQMSRVDSVIAATHVAKRTAEARGVPVAHPVAGSVMATDGFFPFPDAVEAAAEAGATAVAHPGGARQDEAAIAAADRLGLAMVVTGVRHFRH